METLKTIDSIHELFQIKNFTELLKYDQLIVKYVLNSKFSYLIDEYNNNKDGDKHDLDQEDSDQDSDQEDSPNNKRLFGQLFRENILKQFNNKCPLSGYPGNLCQACHIYEYKDCDKGQDKYSRYNGILLSPNLHLLYDNNYFIINPDNCCIEVLKTIPNSEQEINGKYIKELDNYDSKEYLRKRINKSINV